MLETRNIFKSFGSVQALTDVDFEVRAGEVMSLVGDNGAGKSTLIKCIAGIYSIDEGDVFFEGEKVSISGPKDAAKLGIEVVYQDLALCDNLDVVQNMYLGREERDVIWRLKESVMEAKTSQTLKSLSVTTIRSIRQPVASLSGGQRQSVAIGRAVMWNSRLVILDEPTAALGVAQTRQVLDLVKRLAAQGLAVVLISHNLHDIFEAADRITVLRLGRNAALLERASDPAGGRARDHRRRPDQGRGSRPDDGRGGAGMSAGDGRDRRRGPGVADGNSLVDHIRRRWEAIKSGRCGNLPVIVGLDPDRRLLLLAGQQLPQRRQLHQPDGADGGRHDHRHRCRVRAPPRGDRPLDRLCVRHRGGRRREAAVPRRELPDVGDRRDHHRDHRHALIGLFQGSFVAIIGVPRSS